MSFKRVRDINFIGPTDGADDKFNSCLSALYSSDRVEAFASVERS